MCDSIEQKLAELGEVLPNPAAPVGSYVPVLRTGNLIFTSGQLPMMGKEVAFKGKVGQDQTCEDGYNAAHIAAVNGLAQLKSVVGNLDTISRIVRVEGFVQCIDSFTEHPQVVNGASDFLVELFGDAGKHTRFAVGVNSLPLNACVEVAIWAEISD